MVQDKSEFEHEPGIIILWVRSRSGTCKIFGIIVFQINDDLNTKLFLEISSFTFGSISWCREEAVFIFNTLYNDIGL